MWLLCKKLTQSSRKLTFIGYRHSKINWKLFLNFLCYYLFLARGNLSLRLFFWNVLHTKQKSSPLFSIHALYIFLMARTLRTILEEHHSYILKHLQSWRYRYLSLLCHVYISWCSNGVKENLSNLSAMKKLSKYHRSLSSFYFDYLLISFLLNKKWVKTISSRKKMSPIH